ncbi:MAG: glycine zipper 2TM domain-containing protein [Burkholderiales bacterium]|nr:glycine zipper 2TM domain-containing protein [Burkholderiales bacterium]
MNKTLKTALAISAICLAGHAAAQITFYEGEGYRGRAFTTNQRVGDFTRYGFNDQASSVVIDRGRWEVCEHARFEGRCVVLRRGSYDSLRALGMENKVSSVRPADNNRRYENEREPIASAPDYEYRRRPSEAVYNVPVTSVRAVVGAPNERCWIERQQVAVPTQQNNNANIGGALIGGLIGGVLGHQVGGGSGKDLATAAGAVGGAVVGSNVANRNGQPGTAIENRDVRKCETTANTTPAYYDVTYNYRGLEHRVQMAAAPGPTIIVNAKGEPRM